MDKAKQKLKGSPSRDMFKQAHKLHTDGAFYACDLDFILVAKEPEGIIAFLDYKKHQDPINFSEVLAYNSLIQLAPLYIVKSNNPEDGPFYIYQYKGGEWKPDPPKATLDHITTCDTWENFNSWEWEIRNKQCQSI